MPTGFPDDAVRVPHTPIEQLTRQVGGPQDTLRAVFRDEPSFTAFWSRVVSTQVPAPSPPSIDFATEMVIVAAMGFRPTAGYAVSIEGVYRTADALWVDVREVSPGAECMVAQMLTAPVAAVRVARADGAVEFAVRRETQNCS